MLDKPPAVKEVYVDITRPIMPWGISPQQMVYLDIYIN